MAMNDNSCVALNMGRRRLFWTTQQEACGRFNMCGVECSIPGLQYEEQEGGRTIKVTDWLRSLILNILNTRARTDIRCPSPMGVFGHWSESYRNDGLYIGSTLWNAANRSYIRISDAVAAVQVAVQADMGKLTATGVADSIKVTASYAGANKISVDIEAITTQGRSRINLSGSFVTQSWVWQ